MRARTAALIIVVCGIAFAIPIVVGAASTMSMQEVSEGLTCQCGCGLTVANCNHPNCEFSVPVREQIDAMLKRGMSGPQVIAFYRGKYGEKILSAPTTEGFNLVAWIMPFAAILGGGALIAITFGRWRSKGSAPIGATESGADGGADSSGFDAELRRALERELRDRT
jgi:cytochrome c-type biogenesis protein CcmH